MTDLNLSSNESAYDIIQQQMVAYGLPELASFVQDLVFRQGETNPSVIVGQIRQTPQYRQRFAGNEARRARGLRVLSEGEYLGLESYYKQVLRNAGMPAGFYDQPDDFNALIGNDVSTAEFAQRINQGYEAVTQANPQVVQEMKRLYGVDDSQLAAYFLDPERATPTLLRQAKSAQIASEANLQAGVGVTAQQAEQLATAGISTEQARSGFQTIAAMQEVFQPLQGEQAISQQEQIAGVFGTEQAAQQRIRQRVRERTAAFEAGGAFTGAGTTRTGLL